MSLSAIKSDFYLFDLVSGRWTQITDDTAAMGGPNLIFDHQVSTHIVQRDPQNCGIERRHLSNLVYGIVIKQIVLPVASKSA